VRRYFEYEKLMHRWIQIELTEKQKLEEQEGINMPHGHHYIDSRTKLKMVELHVNDHHSFQGKMNTTTTYGGNLIIHLPEGRKPLVYFGQDEAIMKQYCFTSKSWTAPTGQKAIIPKDDGMGVMISAFVSREFGFGLQLSQQQLQKVNEVRHATKYSNEEAAKDIRGENFKDPLDNSPFVLQFEYGANNQGYWKYDHMVLQMEDCIDVVKVLWPDFVFIFHFDHSCRHDWRRPDELNTKSLNKGFGGAPIKMRDSKIAADDEDNMGGYPTELTLKLGETQSMQFLSTDEGPC
jgi:hypothetical protein